MLCLAGATAAAAPCPDDQALLAIGQRAFPDAMPAIASCTQVRATHALWLVTYAVGGGDIDALVAGGKVIAATGAPAGKASGQTRWSVADVDGDGRDDLIVRTTTSSSDWIEIARIGDDGEPGVGASLAMSGKSCVAALAFVPVHRGQLVELDGCTRAGRHRYRWRGDTFEEVR